MVQLAGCLCGLNAQVRLGDRTVAEPGGWEPRVGGHKGGWTCLPVPAFPPPLSPAPLSVEASLYFRGPTPIHGGKDPKPAVGTRTPGHGVFEVLLWSVLTTTAWSTAHDQQVFVD